MPTTSSRPTGQLTRDAIVEAAVALLVQGDVGSITIRKLAADLGVSPMALYRHVGSKDDVLLDLTDHLLAEAGLPSRAYGWRRCLLELACTLRDLLHVHPGLVSVFNRGPVTTPAAQARMASALHALDRDGFSSAEAIEAYAAVHTYTIGFSTIAASRSEHQSPAPTDLGGPAAVIASFVSDRQYQIGLDMLLAGIDQRRLARRERGGGPPLDR